MCLNHHELVHKHYLAELEVVAEVVAGLEEVAWLEVAGFEVAGLVDV